MHYFKINNAFHASNLEPFRYQYVVLNCTFTYTISLTFISRWCWLAGCVGEEDILFLYFLPSGPLHSLKAQHWVEGQTGCSVNRCYWQNFQTRLISNARLSVGGWRTGVRVQAEQVLCVKLRIRCVVVKSASKSGSLVSRDRVPINGAE